MRRGHGCGTQARGYGTQARGDGAQGTWVRYTGAWVRYAGAQRWCAGDMGTVHRRVRYGPQVRGCGTQVR